MAIYAARGLCAAVYLIWTYQTYNKIYPSFPCPEKNISEGPIKDFVTIRAQAMGLKKELFVYAAHSHYCCVGSAFFQGKAGIGIDDADKIDEACTQFMITHEIAHVKANDQIICGLVPLVASIFTTFLLTSIAPIAACAAGLAAGLLTFFFVFSWREKVADITAMQYSSDEVNRAVLEELEKLKKQENQFPPPLLSRVFDYFTGGPSLDQQIRYFKAHIEA